jgi:hypothetical protein
MFFLSLLDNVAHGDEELDVEPEFMLQVEVYRLIGLSLSLFDSNVGDL